MVKAIPFQLRLLQELMGWSGLPSKLKDNLPGSDWACCSRRTGPQLPSQGCAVPAGKTLDPFQNIQPHFRSNNKTENGACVSFPG